MMKRVSVVVLSYRSADTICQTLDSICKQTYNDIELIITDDCSPDNTVAVVKEWIKTSTENKLLSDIKLVTAEANTGIPGNINRALKQVSGEYVKIIAADDYMTPNAIQEYVDFCESNEGVLPIAKLHLFADKKDEKTADFSSVQKYCDKCYEFARLEKKEQYRLLLIQNRIAAPSASFYPTELLRKVNGYDEHYRWFEDYPMNLKVMHQGYGFGLIDKEIVYYRLSGQSITASQEMRLKKAEMKLFFRQKMWYMIQNGMALEAIKQSKSWIRVAFRGK